MRQRVTGKYPYCSADGEVLYWKERIEPGRKSAKEFRFYHGTGQLGRGSDPVVYNLPNVIKAKAVIFTEGEKQADIVNGWGLCGTTFDSGSNSKFPPDMVEVFRGKRIAVLRDNDEPGQAYAEMICQKLHGICEVSKIVLLPGLPHKGDICDWHSAANNKARLLEVIKAAADHVYTPPEVKPRVEKREIITGSDITDEMVAAAKSVPVDTLLEFQGGYAYCLWHEEDNPSLHYHGKSNRVKCFSCGFGGSPVDIIIKREGLGFKDAVRYLCGG